MQNNDHTPMPHHSSLTNVTPANNSLPRYSRARQLARSLGLSTRTLFRWAHAGLISRFRLNSRVTLFSLDEVAAFLASSRVQTATCDHPHHSAPPGADMEAELT